MLYCKKLLEFQTIIIISIPYFRFFKISAIQVAFTQKMGHLRLLEWGSAYSWIDQRENELDFGK